MKRGMFRLMRKSDRAMAFAAGFVFLLQMLTHGPLLPEQRLDFFGNPLCIAAIHHDDSGPAQDHPALPDCCAAICGAPSPFTASAAGSNILAQALPRGMNFTGIRQGIRIEAPEHNPGGPRGPPHAA